ncbi:CMGC SRPK kinase [Babesia ovis]|uniref:non-specific serine/threonine protein kinase n=1 Tax=Babesia ovis TaxID=5869 RepID=A0A9W5WTX7_BABOV|nr:CMGC SRPK kinase [Babesia ovis]
MGKRKSLIDHIVSTFGRMDLGSMKSVNRDDDNNADVVLDDECGVYDDSQELDENKNGTINCVHPFSNGKIQEGSENIHGLNGPCPVANHAVYENTIKYDAYDAETKSVHSTEDYDFSYTPSIHDRSPILNTDLCSDADIYDTSAESDEHDGSSETFDCVQSDSEDADAYVPGGYHPVKRGECYDDRYRIECKLGWGYFSTVWLASDTGANPPSFVAIKFQRSAQNHTDVVRDEMALLKKVRDQVISRLWLQTKGVYKEQLGSLYNNTRGVVSFLNWFRVKGPNGTHICLVLEPMGPNLLSLIKFYKFKGVPIALIKKITAHVLLGLDYLHRICGIIHTDLKPENILVTSKIHNCTPYSHKEGKSENVKKSVEVLKIDVPYVKNSIRPSLSDPTSLTSYEEPAAVQDTMYRMPYHHVPYKIAEPLRDAKEKAQDSSMYHPWVASKVCHKPLMDSLSKQHISVRTQQGVVKLKPIDLATFDRPDAIYKICDLGNACWVHHHFTDEIQTRQYRSPEAILKVGYDQSTDLWSLACIIFELFTGDYLFDPTGNTTQERDINHLQLIVELLGPIPRSMIKASTRFRYYEREINGVKPWPLESVLVKKYKMSQVEAHVLSEFLLCMLKVNPKDRKPAEVMLGHEWLHSGV